MNKARDDEIWKDIPGYEGIYQVSTKGRVRSFWKKEPHILKQTLTTTGYKKVELYKDKKRKTYKVHRLVALAFILNSENKPNINHKDGNPLNNTVENLEWCTQKENVEHAIKTGLKKVYKFEIKELKELYKIYGLKKIAKMYNTSFVPIKKTLKNNNIPIKKGGAQIKYNLTKEFILNELKSKTQKQLAKEIGCNASLISHYLKRIKTRGDIYAK